MPDRLPKHLTPGERERPPKKKEGESRFEKRSNKYNNSEKLRVWRGSRVVGVVHMANPLKWAGTHTTVRGDPVDTIPG